MMHVYLKCTFRKKKKRLYKGKNAHKINLNLLENINLYHCCELTTQNMKIIKNFRSQLSKVLKIQYQHNNTLSKILFS